MTLSQFTRLIKENGCGNMNQFFEHLVYLYLNAHTAQAYELFIQMDKKFRKQCCYYMIEEHGGNLKLLMYFVSVI